MKFYPRERNLTEILDLLWPFTTFQPRIIQVESRLTREAGRVPSLQNVSRDTVLLILLAASNNQEILARPLVERLGLEEELTVPVQECLLASYSERMEESV